MLSDLNFSMTNSIDQLMGDPSRGVCPSRDYTNRNDDGTPQLLIVMDHFGKLINRSMNGMPEDVQCTSNPLYHRMSSCAYRAVSQNLSGAAQIQYNQDMIGIDSYFRRQNVTMEEVYKSLYIYFSINCHSYKSGYLLNCVLSESCWWPVREHFVSTCDVILLWVINEP